MDQQSTTWKRCLILWMLALTVGTNAHNATGQFDLDGLKDRFGGGGRKGNDIERAVKEAEQKAEDLQRALVNIPHSLDQLTANLDKYVPAVRQAELAAEFTGLLLRSYGDEALPLDLSNAVFAARHAERSYLTPAEIKADLGSGVHCGVFTEKLTAIQYYWIKEADRQVIAIRGTVPTEPLNLLADFVTDIEADPLSGIDAHEGFLVASQLVHVSVLPQLDPELPVLITGHSLGGSIATLLGLRLQVTGFNVEVVTFGAPKVTTLKTLKSSPDVHRLPLRRFVNSGDAVPHFPIPTNSSGERIYAHFGAEWQLAAEGIERTDLVIGLIQSVAVVTDPTILSWSLDHHAISVYRQQLDKLAIAALAKPAPSPVAEEVVAPKKRGFSIGGLKLPFGG